MKTTFMQIPETLNDAVTLSRSCVAEATPLLDKEALSRHLRDLGCNESYIVSFNKCGKCLGYCDMDCDCGHSQHMIIHNCNCRVCPTCALRRKNRLKARYLPIMRRFNNDRSYFYYFLTISPENCVDIQQGVKKIQKDVYKFFRLKDLKGKIKGKYMTIEIKKSLDGSFNIHSHFIIYGRWLDNKVRVVGQDSMLVRNYKRCSKGNVIIDIRRLNSYRDCLNYLLKYISVNKNEFESMQDLAYYVYSVKDIRLVSTSGVFYGIKREKNKICWKCGSKRTYKFTNEIYIDETTALEHESICIRVDDIGIKIIYPEKPDI